jgi:hypothetical protein
MAPNLNRTSRAGARFSPYNVAKTKKGKASKPPKSYAQLRQERIDQEFADRYTACSGSSFYHDLRCGHRILSLNSSESCGRNCKKKGEWAPFLCPECVAYDVRLEMTFEDISLSVSEDADMKDGGATREEQILAIAEAEIKKILRNGGRVCKVTPKFDDPKIQFFNQFLTEEGHGGIDETGKAKVEPEKKKLKRSGLWKHADKADTVPNTSPAAMWKARESQAKAEQDDEDDAPLPFAAKAEMQRDWEFLQAQFSAEKGANATLLENLTEEMGQSHIEPLEEDDAMKAVRKALGTCAIGLATAAGAQ